MEIKTAYDTIMGFGMDKITGFLGQFFAECLETLSIVSYDFLVVAGLIGNIIGAGTDTIKVTGVKELKAIEGFLKLINIYTLIL